MQHYLVRSLKEHKGSPRIYLDVMAMEEAGFAPGKTYVRSMDPQQRKLKLSVAPNGTHVVSKKEKGDRVIPVIDINSASALGMFEGMDAVRIVVEKDTIWILPLASEVKRSERLQTLAEHMDAGEVTTAGISFGGGTMDHAAHAGLKEAGLRSRLAMANEIDEGLLQHAKQHNDIWNASTVGLAAPLQELVQDEAAMRRLGRVDIAAAGLPCSGASQAGKSKRGLTMMEDHPMVGHLAASFLMLMQRINPAVIVLENVPQYSSSGSAMIIRHHLRDCGYDVQEVELDAADFGCLEARRRWFLVAASRGIELDLSNLQPRMKPVRTLSEVLEPIGPDAEDWRTFDYLKTKEARDKADGKGFMMQVVTPESTSCPTLRKGYHKGGSTDPLLAHPSNPDLLRQLTVKEHARIKEVPEHLVEGLSKTDGHILLGQGIAYAPVKALFRRIGECLLQWKSTFQGSETHQQLGYSLKLATG